MKADRRKLSLAMANACMNTKDLREKAQMPRQSLYNVMSGRNVRPGTIGKVAKALEVSVESIIETEVSE